MFIYLFLLFYILNMINLQIWYFRSCWKLLEIINQFLYRSWRLKFSHVFFYKMIVFFFFKIYSQITLTQFSCFKFKIFVSSYANIRKALTVSFDIFKNQNWMKNKMLRYFYIFTSIVSIWLVWCQTFQCVLDRSSF